MEINTKITLSVDDLKDFCEALGWNNNSPLTKQQFFKEAIGRYVRQIIKGKRAFELDKAKREELKIGTEQIEAAVGAITAD